MSPARDLVVAYPGGLRARYRWAGSGEAAEVFALSESGASLADLGPTVDDDPDALCRAELHVDTPSGSWAVRLASRIYDEPDGLSWDVPGLLLVRYGFHLYAFAARTGVLAWSHRSATPLVSLHASSRLDLVIAVAEIETVALDAEGNVGWRVAHSDVVSESELVAGRLVLTGYTGEVIALDAETGRTVG